MNLTKSQKNTRTEEKEIYIEEFDHSVCSESTYGINKTCRRIFNGSKDDESKLALGDLKKLCFKPRQTGAETTQDENTSISPSKPSKRSQTWALSENYSVPMLLSPSQSSGIWMPSRRDQDSDSSFGKNWTLPSNTRHIMSLSQD